MITEIVEAREALGARVNETLGQTRKKAFNKLMEVGVRTGFLDKFADSVAQRLPRLVQVQGLTPEFTSKFLDLTRINMVPEVVIGHFSHLDHVVVSHFCHKLKSLTDEAGLGDNLNGFVETLARSVSEGQQSVFMMGVYSRMEAYAKERDLEFIQITRDEDVDRYGMSKKISERRLLVNRLREKGIGLLVPAGGSVQPGRHPKGASGDQIFGLQEILDTDILDLYDLMKRLGRHSNQEPYFLPLAVDKTYRIYNVDSLLPTPEGLFSIYAPSRILDLLDFLRVGVKITPAMPLTPEDMAKNLGSDWRSNSKEAVDFLMTEIARNLPPNARGYYGRFV